MIIIVTKLDEHTYTATCRDVPDVTVQAPTADQAVCELQVRLQPAGSIASLRFAARCLEAWLDSELEVLARSVARGLASASGVEAASEAAMLRWYRSLDEVEFPRLGDSPEERLQRLVTRVETLLGKNN